MTESKLSRRTIACVVGARPNFVKMGPVLAGLRSADPELRPLLVHTGQHYDRKMSDVFFEQLGLPEPDVHLEVGAGTQGEQTARILERFEALLLAADPRPAAVVVVGDVTSTLACTLAAVKVGVPVVHVEAGLRSYDRTMPEEINRVVTDSVSELLLVSEPDGIDNLRKEGRPDEAIRLVGNVMIDVLLLRLAEARSLDVPARLGLQAGGYAVWTMHRPSNVDAADQLRAWVDAMVDIARRLPTVFPVHPRTKDRLIAAGLWDALASAAGVRLLDPLGYLEFLCLTSQSRLLMTDSGGLQEEAAALGVPCLTLRDSTERPITVTHGTSTLIGHDADLLRRVVDEVLAGRYKRGAAPPLWDGRAGERIGREIVDFLARRGRANPPDRRADQPT
jgi:UDP-N-acetylglucosamine 2-epimerase (non-hydrolysing)